MKTYIYLFAFPVIAIGFGVVVHVLHRRKVDAAKPPRR